MPLADLRDETADAGSHLVQVYDGEDSLARAVSGFLGAGLAEGARALIVATPAHEVAILGALTEAGLALPALSEEGQLCTVDPASMLAVFASDGMPDAELFEASVGQILSDLCADGRPVRVFGEMVALLWASGNVAGAMSLERLWNLLAERLSFRLFCGYPAHAVDARPDGRERLLHVHSGWLSSVPAPATRDDWAARRYESVLSASPAARRFVTDTLAGWGRRHLSEAAEVVISELVGNAIRYGRGRFRVEVTQLPAGVRLAVSDLSEELPARRYADPKGDTGGRGLHLVDALAHDWGAHRHDGGKTVWADLLSASD